MHAPLIKPSRRVRGDVVVDVARRGRLGIRGGQDAGRVTVPGPARARRTTARSDADQGRREQCAGRIAVPGQPVPDDPPRGSTPPEAGRASAPGGFPSPGQPGPAVPPRGSTRPAVRGGSAGGSAPGGFPSPGQPVPGVPPRGAMAPAGCAAACLGEVATVSGPSLVVASSTHAAVVAPDAIRNQSASLRMVVTLPTARRECQWRCAMQRRIDGLLRISR